jgi:hypothetical protein
MSLMAPEGAIVLRCHDFQHPHPTNDDLMLLGAY